MKTSIRERPLWSTERSKEIRGFTLALNKKKQFAWECGWKQIPWQTVKKRLHTYEKGSLLEIAMAYLFGFINLPVRLSFTQEDDMAGADLVFKKTGIDHKLKIQLKWNNHEVDDSKYTKKGITVVHVDDGMKPADVVKQFQLWRLLGANWYKRITTNHLMMVHHVLNNL